MMRHNHGVSPVHSADASTETRAAARPTTAQRRARSRPADAACAAAIEVARAAVIEVTSPGQVGDYMGLQADGDRLVTHYFACLDPAYRGWRWAVSITRASRAKTVTVSESVLLPGDDALLPPEWVPWSERLRPGDLGPGDLLPTPPDDVRLAPGFTQTGDDETDHQAVWEPGLGRSRVLSETGREEAAARWYAGEGGPDSPVATAAPAPCSTCGFFVLLDGPLRRMFGVCANEYAPDDGRVVSADHGCGAHSEAVVAPPTSDPSPPIVDEIGYDIMHSPGSVDEDTSEPHGRS
jgi:hypothetical protein